MSFRMYLASTLRNNANSCAGTLTERHRGRSADEIERLRVMVGGAPVDQKFADRIGGDGDGQDAADAVDPAKSLMASGAW